MIHDFRLSRRSFLAGSAATVAALPVAHSSADDAQRENKFCAFIKFVQSLSYDAMAETIAELGFDGIEATVREKGQIAPEEAEDELPKLVEALRRCGLEITVMASSINSVDQPHTEKVLRTAASLGIQRYRMTYYRYDEDRPLPQQLADFRRELRALVAMNRELGIAAVYQNHAGARYVGAPVWDLHQLIRDFSVDEVGVAFDIRHATVEGGSAWPLHYRLMKPHLGAVYVKDFVWKQFKADNIALGKGQVDPKFFQMLRKDGYAGPISLHVEYLPQAGLDANVRALGKDLKTLKSLLATS